MVIDVIISLCRDKHFGEVSTRMCVAIDVVSKEDSSSGKKIGISHNGKGAGDIQDAKNWSEGKGSAKGVEGFLLK